MAALNEFWKQAWKRYVRLAPDAQRIHALLERHGETQASLINDHVAFRTFRLPGLGRHDLGKIFEAWGYRLSGDTLDFPEKKLQANYWIHPDPAQPKVFISELILDSFEKPLREWIEDLGDQARKRFPKLSADIFLEPSWNPVRFEDYQTFYPKSEYAGWTGAFGIQVNHFTVFVNRLKTFPSLQELNGFLKAEGIKLNQAAGEVKGTPSELLEQTSTEAQRVACEFADGIQQSAMGCYYEFARRYTIPGSGELFHGFIPKSADKIFESNFEKKK